MFNIGVIGPKESINNIKNIIEDLDFDFKVSTYSYDSLPEIIEIYRNNIKQWDYLLLSGILLYVYLNHNLKKIEVPNDYIDLDDSYVYGKIINYLLQNPSKDLSRLYFDFIGEINNFIGLKNFIRSDQMPFNNSMLTLDINKFSESDLKQIHRRTIDETKKLWDKNKIDYVFSRMPEISESLYHLGIPHQTILPSKENIINSFKKIKKEIEISNLKKKENAVAFIDLNFEYQNEIQYQDNEYKEITMHKILVDFRKENNFELSIIKTHNGFKLNFSKELIEDDISKFELVNYIETKYDYSFNIGISFNYTIEAAIFYALKGMNESKNYGDKTAFIVDSHNNVTGPLTKDECLKYKVTNNILEHYAKEMSISPFNLARIIALEQNGIKLLNSNLIKKYCNITKRSANRILKKLEKNNIIEFFEKKKLNEGKGRPTKVYKLNKDHKIYLSLINNIN